jgi:hypothetical protein
MVAREMGSDYSITSTKDTCEATFTDTAGTDKTLRDFYRIVLQVYIKDLSGEVSFLDNFVQIGEDSVTPDGSGVAEFDISEYLKPELSSDITYPEDMNTLLIKHAELSKEFMFRYAEVYDGTVRKLEMSGGMFALKGGVSKYILGRLNETDSDFNTWWGSKGQFLSWHPDNKLTRAGVPEKLYWLNMLGGTKTILYLVRIYRKSNLSPVTVILGSKAGVVPGDILEVICGVDVMNNHAESAPSDSVDSEDILYYDIALAYVGNYGVPVMVTVWKRFTIDDTYNINEKVFLFRNSFGAYESVRMNGARGKTAEYERQIVENSPVFDFTFGKPEQNQRQVTEQQTFVCNSGFKRRQYIDWLRELMLSKDVYELDNKILFPVIISQDKVALEQDDNFLYNLEFEYRRAYSDEHYSVDASTKINSYEYAIRTMDGLGYNDIFE